jgi:hypothetical protein
LHYCFGIHGSIAIIAFMSSQLPTGISKQKLDQLGQDPKFVTAKSVCETLWAKGFKCYFVGGSVRDILIGRLGKDYDLATSALPEQIEAVFPKTIAIGKAFGIITVIQNGIPIEVATFRSESTYTDGRHPEKIQFTDEKTDALRRDFTVNALFWDPRNSEIIDYVNGLSDLQNRILKTVGDPQARFTEDYLRLIRLIRFQSQLGFEIEAKTLEAFNSQFIKALQVSAERLTQEFDALLKGQHLQAALTTLQSCQFFHKFFQLSQPLLSPQNIFSEPDFRWAQFLVYVNVANDPEQILKFFKLSSQIRQQIDHYLFWFAQKNIKDFQNSWFEKIFKTGSFQGLSKAHELGLVSADWYQNLAQVYHAHHKTAPQPIVGFNDLPVQYQKPNPETGLLLKRIYWIQLKESITDRELLIKKGLTETKQ